MTEIKDLLLALPIRSKRLVKEMTDLDMVGGKGMNLLRLSQAGLNIPTGFILTTNAYRLFTSANGLDETIAVILKTHDKGIADPEILSSKIRAAFSNGRVPLEVSTEILSNYEKLEGGPVAVRSSATFEDLPDTSFAGQQDTYLNIIGNDALLKAIVDCWSSLWTARAISYRIRNHISHERAALAVIIQEMVQSEVSGVLFTANPLTGLRTQVVIDATFGLGEALVSGKVEPDHYEVDLPSLKITRKMIGTKSFVILSQLDGGTISSSSKPDDSQALEDDQILALARLGKKVADLNGIPQDIEWALSKGAFHLLQTRPITSLFPTPDGMSMEPLKVMFSFAAVQGVMDPITPLGCDILKYVFAIGANLFGYNKTPETQNILFVAGQRLWANFSALFRNTTGRSVIRGALSMVEPTVQQALEVIWDEPSFQPGKPGISFHTKLHLARFFIPLAGNVFLNILSPNSRGSYIRNNGENLLEIFRAKLSSLPGTGMERLVRQLDTYFEIIDRYIPRTLVLFISGVAAGMASFNALNQLARRSGEESNGDDKVYWKDVVLEVTRSLPGNPTTEMDLSLWDIARELKKDPPSLQAMRSLEPHEMAKRFQQGILPPVIQQVVEKFLERYGNRGFAEIDIGRARWAEDPTHIFEALTGYIQINDQDRDPNVVFAGGLKEARKAVGQIVFMARKSRHGWIKAALVKFFARRVRALMGLREAPKFFAVRMFGLLRLALVETGKELVKTGDLQTADDLFFLTFKELREFSTGVDRNWPEVISKRREIYQREFLRKQIPRLLLSDGRAFYEGMNHINGDENSMTGSPVSPGSVEGVVRVVFDPRKADLLPGEIMVCPGTDPSWTPLFLTASALIMEVGGMMTHGAVVAREYGIPAVVGVHQATSRLKTGQRVRINGSSGIITLLEKNSER